MTDEWEQERGIIRAVFDRMLAEVTGDGSKKRQAGAKPPWWRDQDHKAAVWSHFRKHEKGELKDADSGAHPFVHAAWRLLAIAYQETYGCVDPNLASGLGAPGLTTQYGAEFGEDEIVPDDETPVVWGNH